MIDFENKITCKTCKRSYQNKRDGKHCDAKSCNSPESRKHELAQKRCVFCMFYPLNVYVPIAVESKRTNMHCNCDSKWNIENRDGDNRDWAQDCRDFEWNSTIFKAIHNKGALKLNHLAVSSNREAVSLDPIEILNEQIQQNIKNRKTLINGLKIFLGKSKIKHGDKILEYFQFTIDSIQYTRKPLKIVKQLIYSNYRVSRIFDDAEYIRDMALDKWELLQEIITIATTIDNMVRYKQKSLNFYVKEPKSTIKVCEHCGSEAETIAQFCAMCGYSFSKNGAYWM